MHPLQLSHSFKFNGSVFIDPKFQKDIEDKVNHNKILDEAQSNLQDTKLFLQESVKAELIGKNEIALFVHQSPIKLVKQALSWFSERVIPVGLQSRVALERGYYGENGLKLVFTANAGEILYHDTLNEIQNEDLLLVKEYVYWYFSRESLMTSVKWHYLFGYSKVYEVISEYENIKASGEKLGDTEFLCRLDYVFEEFLDEEDGHESLLYFLTHEYGFELPIDRDDDVFESGDKEKIHKHIREGMEAFLEDVLLYVTELYKRQSYLESLSIQEVVAKAKSIDVDFGELVQEGFASGKELISLLEKSFADTQSDIQSLNYALVVCDDVGLDAFVGNEVDKTINSIWDGGEETGFTMPFSKKGVEAVNGFPKYYDNFVDFVGKIADYK